MHEELNKQLAAAMAQGLPENCGEVIIREGQALPVREPERVIITGTIDAPARFAEMRSERIPQIVSHVLVNREEMTIKLSCNENNPYGSRITGKLEISPEFKKMGINSGNYITNFEMAELIKMNRAYFENRQEAMKLVSDLQQFKARVNKEVEDSNDNRGNRHLLLDQAVQHNLPEKFTLDIPLFKGEGKQHIEVEVYVNPADLTMTLVSPEANDRITDGRDFIMDAVITRISEATPDVVIIEQ